MCNYYVWAQVNQCVESSPDFKPNRYYDKFSYHEFDSKGMTKVFMSMIDERENEVLDVMERQLCELFRKNEILLAEYVIKGEYN